MNKIKEFFNSKLGKKVERYMWHVGVLSIGLLITIGADLNITWIVMATPLLTSLTKWVNLNYIKK